MIPYYDWRERPGLSATYLRPDHADIGVSPGLFERDLLTYSGKLLVEAHARDPNSPYRGYTLYSTIFGESGETSTEVPLVSAAEAYLREFPQGPFVIDVHIVAAHFYNDLYQVVALEQSGRRIDYKFECYNRYITAQPLSVQRATAREAAIRYYERLVELLPMEVNQARYLEDLRQESPHGWFFCGD